MTLQMPQADELVLNNKENIILDLKKFLVMFFLKTKKLPPTKLTVLQPINKNLLL